MEKPYQNISKDRALKIVEILIRTYEQFDFEMSKKYREHDTLCVHFTELVFEVNCPQRLRKSDLAVLAPFL